MSIISDLDPVLNASRSLGADSTFKSYGQEALEYVCDRSGHRLRQLICWSRRSMHFSQAVGLLPVFTWRLKYFVGKWFLDKWCLCLFCICEKGLLFENISVQIRSFNYCYLILDRIRQVAFIKHFFSYFLIIRWFPSSVLLMRNTAFC